MSDSSGIRESDEVRARAIATALLSSGWSRLDPSSRPATNSGPDRAPDAEDVEEEPGVDRAQIAKFLRWYDGVLRVQRMAGRTLAEEMQGRLSARIERSGVGDDERLLLATIMRAHRLLLEHPVAAKAGFTALAEEGRRFARTAEGAALRDRLARSRKIHRLAVLWRAVSMDMLVEERDRELPSAFVDSLLGAAERSDLEQLLGLVFDGWSPK